MLKNQFLIKGELIIASPLLEFICRRAQSGTVSVEGRKIFIYKSPIKHMQNSLKNTQGFFILEVITDQQSAFEIFFSDKKS